MKLMFFLIIIRLFTSIAIRILQDFQQELDAVEIDEKRRKYFVSIVLVFLLINILT